MSEHLSQHTARTADDAAYIAIAGELDIATVPALDRDLRLAEAGTPLVVLDLRELEFIDSSGTHLLLATHRRMCAAGGRLVVVRGAPEVTWLLELIGLDLELELVDWPPPGAVQVAA